MIAVFGRKDLGTGIELKVSKECPGDNWERGIGTLT